MTVRKIASVRPYTNEFRKTGNHFALRTPPRRSRRGTQDEDQALETRRPSLPRLC